VDYGFRLPSAVDNRPLTFEEWDARRPLTTYVSATPGPFELERTGGQVVEQVIRPTGLIDPPVELRPVENQVDDLMAEIQKTTAAGFRTLVTTLTKKMAEQLTDYLNENGTRVRYMHADIDTLERMEIVRGLRLGEFDVLVGINLLREGLDLPEVALVAILDADKEGYLRSTTALIQTIGRAARNTEGHVICYADRVTDSLRGALEETDRRRAKQVAFNTAHGITPQTIKKDIHKHLEKQAGEGDTERNKRGSFEQRVAEERKLLAELPKNIAQLRRAMVQAAEDLEFEKAAALRDQLKELEAQDLALRSGL